jgi:hypothetical protein
MDFVINILLLILVMLVAYLIISTIAFMIIWHIDFVTAVKAAILSLLPTKKR